MDYNQIKNIIKDIEELNVNEVSLEFPDGIKISVKKNNNESEQIVKQNISEVTTNNIQIKNQEVEVKEDKEDYKIIKSPMVGTFY